MQGPETYLNELGVTLACAVDSSKAAVLDREHRIFVNYETCYVSSLDARDAFLAAPYRYTGRVTDPVTRSRFVPGPNSPRREYDGRLYLFSGEGTAGRFDASPEQFAAPMVTMGE